jgi:hypothetical protein
MIEVVKKEVGEIYQESKREIWIRPSAGLNVQYKENGGALVGG